MRHPLLLLILLAIIPSMVSAQAYQDTIFTYKLDTIVCGIDYLDLQSVYYKYIRKDGKKRINAVDKIDISSITKDSIRYYDLSMMTLDSDPIVEEDSIYFSESNGIIYPTHLDSPPVFQGGELDILRYMQSNVRNQAEHADIFGNSFVQVLYEATIDSNGAIHDVNISQSSIVTGNFAKEGIELENQIKGVIAQMPDWTPAFFEGKSVSVDIYIPIKFRVEQYAIIMYSGEQAFVFSNMR